MKKTLLLISFIAILAGFSGCTKEYYYTDDVVRVTVYHNEWRLVSNADEEYYFCEKHLNGLNPSIIKNARITADLQIGSDSYPTLYNLPYSRSYDDGETFYTKTISFEVISPDKVAFRVEHSDLYFAEKPETMYFRVYIPVF